MVGHQPTMPVRSKDDPVFNHIVDKIWNMDMDEPLPSALEIAGFLSIYDLLSMPAAEISVLYFKSKDADKNDIRKEVNPGARNQITILKCFNAYKMEQGIKMTEADWLNLDVMEYNEFRLGVDCMRLIEAHWLNGNLGQTSPKPTLFKQQDILEDFKEGEKCGTTLFPVSNDNILDEATFQPVTNHITDANHKNFNDDINNEDVSKIVELHRKNTDVPNMMEISEVTNNPDLPSNATMAHYYNPKTHITICHSWMLPHDNASKIISNYTLTLLRIFIFIFDPGGPYDNTELLSHHLFCMGRDYGSITKIRTVTKKKIIQ